MLAAAGKYVCELEQAQTLAGKSLRTTPLQFFYPLYQSSPGLLLDQTLERIDGEDPHQIAGPLAIGPQRARRMAFTAEPETGRKPDRGRDQQSYQSNENGSHNLKLNPHHELQ